MHKDRNYLKNIISEITKLLTNAELCDCECHVKYGHRSLCEKCIEKHKASPHYKILKKFSLMRSIGCMREVGFEPTNP